jgi:hypothetical protein
VFGSTAKLKGKQETPLGKIMLQKRYILELKPMVNSPSAVLVTVSKLNDTYRYVYIKL